MKINTITITGADDSIQPKDLVKLSEKYPFVEWAILLSEKQMGNKRFPSKNWMQELAQFARELNLAGHLCGKWLKNLMSHGDISFAEEIPLWPYFKRVQLNFHAEPINLSLEALQTLRNESWKNGKNFIVQMDGVNNKIYEDLVFSGVNASGLFDTSHGTGVLPKEWPDVIPSIDPNAYRGYAGGLGPDNLFGELIKLGNSVGDLTIWIDMETNVRSNNDLQFDLSKVEKCLLIALQWT